MLRAMMLTLTLILITLVSAYLGRDEQLTQVLYRTKTPVESSSAVESVSKRTLSSSDVSSEKEFPRFAQAEPDMSAQINAEETDGHSSQLPQAQAVGDEQPYQPPAPTEQQKMDTADPYVKELFQLTESSSRQLKQLVDEVLTEYLLTAPDKRSDIVAQLTEKYMPRAQKLEQDTDAQADAILLKMEAALSAIGADDGIVQDARAAYQNSKQEQMERYSDILAFSQS